MPGIIATAHRDAVRIERALRRFRDAYASGELLRALELFEDVESHIRSSFTWEENRLAPLVERCNHPEEPCVLERDASDHAAIRVALERIRALNCRALNGEMGLDQPVLELVDALTRLWTAHRIDGLETLCGIAERDRPADSAQAAQDLAPDRPVP